MFLDKKTPSYIDYRNVKSTFEFIDITNDNIPSILKRINDYINTYSKSKYVYELRKVFLLKLRVSIDKKTDINLKDSIDVINEHAKGLFDCSQYNDDSQEEKDILFKSYKTVIYNAISKKVEDTINQLSSPENINKLAKDIAQVCSTSLYMETKNTPDPLS